MRIRKSFPDTLVLKTHYFIYFGMLAVFLPFFNLYCYNIQFSGFEIGVISSVRSAVQVLFAILWGKIADRFRSGRIIFIGCCIVGPVFWSLYLFTTDFTLFLFITALYSVFFAPIISFMEAFTMETLETRKNQYGKIRLWGSISFICIVLSLGKILEHTEISIIIPLILIGSVIQAGISFFLPGNIGKTIVEKQEEKKRVFPKKTIFFLFCAFLMLVSHGAYYGFFSIHLENHGFSRGFIGTAWAVGVLAEIFVMYRSEKLFDTFSVETVLFLTFIAAGVRWILMGISDSRAVILFAQLLHAVTYAAFHIASILYIDYLMPDHAKTTGQAINNAVTYGLGLMVGFFLNGYLFEIVESSTLFLISAVIAFLGGLLFRLARKKEE